MESDEKSSCCAVSRQQVCTEKVNSAISYKQMNRLHDKMALQTNSLYIPEGNFLMGSEDTASFPADGEGPVRRASVKPFYIDETTVTNAEFKRFIEVTGYVTDAEKFGWSFVFYRFISKQTREHVLQRLPQMPWWWVVEGATWNQPEGPDSTIQGRMDHPVVHISWNDAIAYCAWVSKRLPTEMEWEYAARGGLEQKKYPWGDELMPGNKHYCNIWQGKFPYENTKEDGYMGTAPVKSYSPNGFGLYQVSGNVWEWCVDQFDQDRAASEKNTGYHHEKRRVIKGGSYLCHYSYCNRYRVAARAANTPDSSTGNMGFRCVTDR